MVSLLSQNADSPIRYSHCTWSGGSRLCRFSPFALCSPSLLASKSLVEQCEHFGDIELHVFEIELILVVLLHLQQVVEFEVKLQKTTVATCQVISNGTKREMTYISRYVNMGLRWHVPL